MAQQNVLQVAGCGKAGQPCLVSIFELAEGRAVGQPHELRQTVHQLPIMIAANGEVIPIHEEIGGAGGLQRTGDVISKVDDYIWSMTEQIRFDCFQSSQISMNVGQYCDSQRATPWTSL